MKKLICAIGFVVVLVSFTSCGLFQPKNVDALPYTFTAAEQEMRVADVSFYQGKTEHGYTLYAVVALDTMGASEDELYWFFNDALFSCSVAISGGENNIPSDAEFLSGAGNTAYDAAAGAMIYYVFYYPSELQYDLTGTDYTLTFFVKDDRGDYVESRLRDRLESGDLKPVGDMSDEAAAQLERSGNGLAATQ